MWRGLLLTSARTCRTALHRTAPRHSEHAAPPLLQASSHGPEFYCPQLGDEVVYLRDAHLE